MNPRPRAALPSSARPAPGSGPRRAAGRAAAALLVAATLLLSGCGGDDGGGGLPAVTENATNLEAPPVIAEGEGDPPEQVLTADLVVGDGDTATPQDTVDVRYIGALYDTAEVFDSSWQRGEAPATFPLSGVVPGFAEGIVGMQVGGRREIVIPPEFGYGDQAIPGIPAGSTLVFVVDLVDIAAE